MATHAGSAARLGRHRSLDAGEKRTLAMLALPTFGLALTITTVSTYLPLVAKRFTGSTTIIGVIIGAEGVMALVLPVVVGAWSDRMQTRLGRRLPFVLAGVPVAAVAAGLLGVAGSMAAVVVLVAVFFAAYFVAYEPYRALYPDLLDEEVAGRAQSTQAVSRGLATALALVGGGLLFAIAQPLPFAAAAGVLTVACGAFAVALLHHGPVRVPSNERAMGLAVGHLARLLRRRSALRDLLIANSLWELSLAALKTFVVLYVTAGLGHGVATAALIVGGTAVFVLAAAGSGGKLADRFGRVRVMRIALLLYGAGLLVPLLSGSTEWIIVPFLPLVAFGGGIVMALPYALLIPMMPADEHGSLTGLYSVSRGIGIILGPVLAGGAIELLRGPLSSTHGYAAMWLVCSLAVFASVPLLRGLRNRDEDADEPEAW
jgi:MFS family permease